MLCYMPRADEGTASCSETGPSVITGQLSWKRETERARRCNVRKGPPAVTGYWLWRRREGPSAKACRRLPGAGKGQETLLLTASHTLMFSPLRPVSDF